MKIIDAREVNDVLNFKDLIPALKETFGGNAGMPQRTVFSLDEGQAHSDAFAVLPSWNDQAIGVKAFTYFPGNPAKGYDTLYSKIMLFNRQTGEPMALVDGTSVTYWRTAAVSALVADFLARKNAEKLLICGTGKLAPFMALAHATIRPIKEITLWGRNKTNATALMQKLQIEREDLQIRVSEDLATDVGNADVISCATGAGEPLILGDWVKPGTHTDFVGNHDRNRRECDSTLIVNGKLFVDSRINVLNEAGELLVPIEEGLITEQHVQAELADLCKGIHKGRENEEEITVYKSVGTALSDLGAAYLVLKKLQT